MPLRILLFGSDGQIGGELAAPLSALGELTSTCYPDTDFTQPDGVRELISATDPNIIINAAAYTAVDDAETNRDAAFAINAEGPALLAEEAQKRGAWLIHYSTDFVFDGTSDIPYTEDDAPHPLSVYGESKLQGDRAIMSAGGRYLIFRTSWIYGLRGKNFLLTMRRLAREKGTVRVVADQVGGPTWCRSVADATAAVLAHVVPNDDTSATGLYNMTCGGTTSWHGFARAILPDSVPVQPIPSSAYPTPAARPAYSVLDCARLQARFGVTLPAWKDALAACLREGTGEQDEQ